MGISNTYRDDTLLPVDAQQFSVDKKGFDCSLLPVTYILLLVVIPLLRCSYDIYAYEMLTFYECIGLLSWLDIPGIISNQVSTVGPDDFILVTVCPIYEINVYL